MSYRWEKNKIRDVISIKYQPVLTLLWEKKKQQLPLLIFLLLECNYESI